MKVVAWLFGIILSLITAVYVVVFTPVGNGLLKPYIEKEIAKNTKLPSRLEMFSLDLSSLHVVLDLNSNNRITVDGNYSLWKQSFDLKYDVALKELQTLQPLTQTQLQDSFYTQGKVVGNLHFLEVDGKSDVAKSNTDYHVELTELNPTSIIATMKSVDVQSLLHMLHQKMYATAQVDVDVHFKNITPHKLNGDVKVTTFDGKLNSAVLKKYFGINVPKTYFTMNLKANMKGDDVDYIYNFDSNLAKVASGGHIVPEPLNVDLSYKFDVKELALLKPLIGADVRGPLHLKGTLQGTKPLMNLQGSTDIAASKTTFAIALKEFSPATVALHVKALKLQKLLYMIKQPHYADAFLDVEMNIPNADMKHLQGSVDTKIYKGVLDNHYLTKAYEFKSLMPRTHFDATTHTTLHPERVNTQLKLHSTLADLFVKDAMFNMKTTSLVSDYKIQLHNLGKLYFVTQQHLKGQFIADGTVQKGKDLDVTMHSDVAQGTIDVKLHNDDLHVEMKKLQTLEILDMLLYPKVIESFVDAKLDYNMVASKGDLKGYITDGHFTKNQVLDLTKKYANIDLYKQTFQGDLGAKIVQENIDASCDLKSNTSEIKTTHTYLNTKTQKIKSTIYVSANKHPLTVKLHGKIASPKVKIDASKIVKKEAKKALEKEINKHIKDKNIQNLLKGLF